MPLAPGDYRPHTILSYSPIHGREIHVTILPKLSQSQLSHAARWAEAQGFRVVRGRRALISIEPAPGVRYTLGVQGWLSGRGDPLAWGRGMVEEMLRLPREPMRLPIAARGISRCSYFALRRTKEGFEVSLNPRAELRGRYWSLVRRRYASTLAADEVYLLGLLALHASPTRILCWTTSPYENSKPVITRAGLFFESRLEPEAFLELVERSMRVSPAAERMARILVPNPQLKLFFEAPDREITEKFLVEAYEGLGWWCYDYRHLLPGYL